MVNPIMIGVLTVLKSGKLGVSQGKWLVSWDRLGKTCGKANAIVTAEVKLGPSGTHLPFVDIDLGDPSLEI